MKMDLDLSGVSAKTGVSTVPTGMYNVEIESATPKETAKKGWMLTILFKVLDGEYAGKLIKENLNIVNSNQDTQKWALSDLKTIMTAGGHKNPNKLGDTDELAGLALKTSVEYVETVKDGETYKNNNFKGYYKADGKVSAPVAATVKKEEPKVAPVETVIGTKAGPVTSGAFPWEQ